MAQFTIIRIVGMGVWKEVAPGSRPDKLDFRSSQFPERTVCITIGVLGDVATNEVFKELKQTH